MEEILPMEEMFMGTEFLGIIAAIVLLMIGAVAAGFFIYRKKKNRVAAPPSRNDGQPIPPAAAGTQPNLVLKCVGGTLNGKSCPISGDLFIGTNAAFCNVLYPEGEPGICGIHCKITAVNGQAQLFDIDSSRTFINGVQLLPNVPYSMPIGSSFYIGTPNNVFIIAENAPSSEAPVPFVHTENIPQPKKRFLWIAIVSAVAVIAAAVILFLLFGKNRDTYTGVTGKAFAIPNVGFANLVFDGKEQTNTARYRANLSEYGWGRQEESKHLSVSLGEDRFIAWEINPSHLPLETGASFNLADLGYMTIDNWNWISTICDGTDYYDSLGENSACFDETTLTVLELDGDEIIFYFYLKLRNHDGVRHTIEGVAHSVLDRDSAPDTYTGISGKTLAMPDMDTANIIFDGKEQTVQAVYGIQYESDGPRLNSRILDVTLEGGMFTKWGYMQWDFDISRLPLKTGASVDLLNMTGRNAQGSLSVSCNGSHYDSYGLDKEKIEEASLTVLELDGDEIIFYFYLKLNNDGESHTLEGLARGVLLPTN